MVKRGLIGMIILGVVVFVLIVAVGAAIYFYNFYVFKTLRVCIGEPTDTMIPCDVTEDCVAFMREQGLEVELEGAPDFIQINFQKILDEIVYCDSSCFMKEVRGVGYETGEFEMLESCEDGEIEIIADIHGKEGLEILKWIKGKEAVVE